MEGFGRAKFGSNKRNWFKLKDGESVFRIIGPVGELAEDGRWSQFYSIHYGYKNSKGEMRTFQSPEIYNSKTKMVEVEDAALQRIKHLTAQLDTARKEKDEDKVTQLLKLVGGQKSRFNLDKNHYLNVIDLQGNIGVLKIRHRCKVALDGAIKKLRDSGVEPLDPENGRFFVFSRTGTSRDTHYQVTVYKKKIHVENVGEVEQDVVHTITPDIARRCLTMDKNGKFNYKEAANLATLFKKPTSEEVTRIVQEGEKAVDEILDGKGTYEGPEENDTDEDSDTMHSSPKTAVVHATNAVTTNNMTVNTTSKSDSGGTKTTNSMNDDETEDTVVTNTVTAKSTTTKTTAQSVEEQSDEEFLKSLGL